PFDRVDADRLVDRCTVAGGLARVVADPADDRRERVDVHDEPPGRLVARRFRCVQPFLRVLTGRAGGRARPLAADEDRKLGTPRPGLVGQARPDAERDRERAVHHASNPNSARFASAMRCKASTMSGRGFVPNRCAYRACGRRYSSTGTRCRIGLTEVTSPCSASYTGNRPDSTANRATLMVSHAAVPQPSGQGTSTCRYRAPCRPMARVTFASRSRRSATVAVATYGIRCARAIRGTSLPCPNRFPATVPSTGVVAVRAAGGVAP